METQPSKDEIVAGKEIKVEIDNNPPKSKKAKKLKQDVEMKDIPT
jgi:hypothetical protein